MRGFDIFMKVAKRIYQAFPDVVFVVVGSDQICYGGDAKHIANKTFLEYVLAKEDYDLSKFLFSGIVPTLRPRPAIPANTRWASRSLQVPRWAPPIRSFRTPAPLSQTSLRPSVPPRTSRGRSPFPLPRSLNRGPSSPA